MFELREIVQQGTSAARRLPAARLRGIMPVQRAAALRAAIGRSGGRETRPTTWRWLSVPATLHQIRMKVLDDARLTEAEREQILWKNAARLFKLDAHLAKTQH